MALGGAVAVAWISTGPVTLSPKSLALALSAALSDGVGLAVLQRALVHGGEGLAIALVQRVTSICVLAILVVVVVHGRGGMKRPEPPLLGLIGAIGLADGAAVLAFSLASRAGGDAVAAVLASLYAIVTVIWAVLILDERVSARQGLAIAVALTGVGLVSGGS